MHSEQLIAQIIYQLKDVRGIQALVLGGSYASGTQHPDSDIDLGLYYYEHDPLDIEHIRAIASSLNDLPDPVVTDLGSWGPWVNGGAWLTIRGQRVDFLYRNIDFVSTIIDESNTGMFRSDYWQQVAYGFHSFMYCTETFICRPIYDPHRTIASLKEKVAHYSPALKQAIIKNFLWRARFALDNTCKPAKRGNTYVVAGSLTRVLHCLVQVLYALNETYYLSEKSLVADVEAFSTCPENFTDRIAGILGMVGTTSDEHQEALAKAEELYIEVAALTRE